MAARRLPRVVAGRRDPVAIRVVEVPDRYVASEESALVRFIDTGDARPTHTPPRPSERGVGGRPTLVDNVETLAHLALIDRFGAPWFRSLGTPDLPGTLLITVDGAVRFPGVYEVAGGTALGTAPDHAGGPSAPVQELLVGGYAGSWLDVPDALDAPLSHEGLRGVGSALGVGLVLALPAAACGLAQTAHLLRYLAGQSAQQCEPCTFGLPGVAEDMADLVAGEFKDGNAQATLNQLRRRIGLCPVGGACDHPDGAARLAASTLHVFAADLDHHLHGRPCRGACAPTLFPIPQRRATPRSR